MLSERCPVPVKKVRMQYSSSNSSENDDIYLSPLFEETYEKLMKDDIVKICMKKYNSLESVNLGSAFSEFTKKCDELLPWIETLCNQNKKQPLCRSDIYLDQICRRRQLLQSSRILNIKMLAKVIVCKEPNLHEEVFKRICDIENQGHTGGLFDDVTIKHILDDTDDDIADLSLWLGDIKKKLNFDIAYSTRKRDIEFIEYILRDFKVHNEISLSIIKVIKELQELAPQPPFCDRINASKCNMDCVESTMHFQWLTAIEYKLRLDEDVDETQRSFVPRYGGLVGHESGFESELSPMYNARKICRTSATPAMGYISSGDNMNDYSTDFPSESGSAVLSMDRTALSWPGLSSSSETVPELSQIVTYSQRGNTSPPKRIVRRKKRRSKRQCQMNHYLLSTEESDLNFQRTSLKRRIYDQSTFPVLEVARYSPQGLNYSEIANAAERMIRRSRLENSTVESSKESEVGYVISPQKGSLNEIDIDKNWDYYQASMYSNEEGDSQIIEVDNIKEWEPEIESDVPEAVVPEDLCATVPDKILMMLTSGYETSIENPGPGRCAKSLLSVLHFTSAHCDELEERLRVVSEQADSCPPSAISSLLNAMAEADSAAHMHLALLREVLHQDSALGDNLAVMEARWGRARRLCALCRLRLLDRRIGVLGNGYGGLGDLRRSLEDLKACLEPLEAVRATLDDRPEDGDSLHARLLETETRLREATVARESEWEAASRCVAGLARSRCARRLLGGWLRPMGPDAHRLNLGIQEEICRQFQECLGQLQVCAGNLCTLSSVECRGGLLASVARETRAWERLCARVPSPGATGGIAQTRVPGRLPLHLAAVLVVAAVVGWWCLHAATGACPSSSPLDLLSLFRRCQDRPHPH